MNNWSSFANCLYITLSRPCWGLAIGVIAIACYFDYVPIINAPLSHWVWKPMAKLTYNAYLIHPILMGVYVGNAEGFQMYSVYEVIFHAWCFFTLAYICAAIMYCIVEKPFGNLCQALAGERPKERSSAGANPVGSPNPVDTPPVGSPNPIDTPWRIQEDPKPVGGNLLQSGGAQTKAGSPRTTLSWT
jgi:peptidoglycan/LPS O-acetylase OafA/YrhL